MTSTQSIYTNLQVNTNPDIAKRISTSTLVQSIVLLLLGAGIFASVLLSYQLTSLACMLLLTSATALILFGLFRLLWCPKEVIYLPTGSVTRETDMFFDLKYLNQLVDMIQQGTMNADVKSDETGNIRLNVMTSKDHNFIAVQLFQFVPYTYNALTPVKCYTGHEAIAMAKFLTNC